MPTMSCCLLLPVSMWRGTLVEGVPERSCNVMPSPNQLPYGLQRAHESRIAGWLAESLLRYHF